MIGRLTFEWAGETLVATLNDDLNWECDHSLYGPLVARSLQALYEPRDNLSPSAGQTGMIALHGAAEWLEASKVELGEPPEDEDERGFPVVY